MKMISTHGLQWLVVDDEPDLVSSLRRILKSKGFRVEGANSGLEAIEWARRHAPDGLIIDLKMPGMNGVEAVREIRAMLPKVHVIFMTGYSELTAEAEAEKPVSVLSKPVDPDQVCALIERVPGYLN